MIRRTPPSKSTKSRNNARTADGQKAKPGTKVASFPQTFDHALPLGKTPKVNDVQYHLETAAGSQFLSPSFLEAKHNLDLEAQRLKNESMALENQERRCRLDERYADKRPSDTCNAAAPLPGKEVGMGLRGASPTTANPPKSQPSISDKVDTIYNYSAQIARHAQNVCLNICGSAPESSTEEIPSPVEEGVVSVQLRSTLRAIDLIQDCLARIASYTTQ